MSKLVGSRLGHWFPACGAGGALALRAAERIAALACVCWISNATAQSLTPVSGLERSRVNTGIFEPTRLQSAGPQAQRTADARAEVENLATEAEGTPAREQTAADPAGAEFVEGLASAILPKSLQFRLGARLRAEYNSNVTVEGGSGRGARVRSGSSVGPQGEPDADFIAAAELDIAVQARFSGGISIGMNLTLGYEQYFANPEFSGIIINSSTPGGVAVRFSTGDVHWTVFDQFSFSNDAADEPELSGVSEFSRFSNAVGLEAAWAPSEYLLLKGGYTRSNTISSAAEVETRDQTSDEVQVTVIHPLNAMLQTGISASAIFSQQTGSGGGDSISYGIGPFLSGQITHATDVLITGGVQRMTFGKTTTDINSSGGESFYASVQINNRLTNFYTHSLSLGRDTQLGLLSDSVTTDYVRYSNGLRIGQQAMLSGNIFAERSEQSGGKIGEQFTRHGGGISLSVPLRPTIGAELGWQYLRKDSDQEGRSYSQHRIFASLTWLF